MKNEKLTADEYDALEHIQRGAAHDRVNACVGRNAKRLAGLKLIQYSKDGRVALTDNGQQMLFLRRCIGALKALAHEPAAPIDADVAQFLLKKSHVAPLPEGKVAITDKGREALADIAATEQRGARSA